MTMDLAPFSVQGGEKKTYEDIYKNERTLPHYTNLLYTPVEVIADAHSNLTILSLLFTSFLVETLNWIFWKFHIFFLLFLEDYAHKKLC